MKVAAGLVRLLNCEVKSDGPLTIDHAPVPTLGVFAASVAGAVAQSA